MSDNRMQNEKQLERMKEIIRILTPAAKAYYSGEEEIMSNFEYDALYDELLQLEEASGIILAGSLTQKVGFEIVSELPKETHPSAMLSLNKTKSVDELAAFAGDQTCILSWKLDGLTVVLRYENGELVKAVTRGNGAVGEVITPNARTFENLPYRIAYKGTLVIRCEALISYEDFNAINETITDEKDRYKNPRNLCSGSVRQLDSAVTAKRHVRAVAFALIEAEGVSFDNSREKQLLWLQKQGFETVEYRKVNGGNMAETVAYFAEAVQKNAYPSDGLVLLYDDIAYGESLGRTAKFPRNAIAFKWKDETATTVLRKVEWSASRTGLINPVAVFDPVELEGTTVSRASVHNVSIVRELMLGVGDSITVYKANMIIPQIAENLTKSNTLIIPTNCPVCGGGTRIESTEGTDTLYCLNPECQAKQVKAFELFVERNAMNIEGISEQTLEKFIDRGFIRTYTDVYHLNRYKDEIVEMDGFGEKSYENIQTSVDKSRTVALENVIYALGIPGVGLANAKLICRAYEDDPVAVMKASEEELSLLDGIGPVLAKAFSDYFANTSKAMNYTELLKELTLIKKERNTASPISGKTFVITGSVNHFANRDELKNYIESQGGKTTGSVSAKTDYLINNDITSNSGKNKKAKELNIPILSEEDFLKLSGKGE